MDADFAVARRAGAGPAEGPLFQPLCHDPEAGAVPVEDLDHAAAAVAEEESRAAGRVGPEVVAHLGGQSVEAFPHVARVDGDVDLQAAVEAEHVSGVCG